MKHFVGISTFILLTMISCNKRQEKIIDLTDGKESLYFSDIVDSLSYIHLETNDSCFFGNVNDIQYEDGTFYIYDILTKSIYSFDKQGKFLSKLTHYGQGPGEYVSISAFAVDAHKNIHIFDQTFNKILVYNGSGVFLYEVRVEDFIRDFYVSDNNYVLCMPDKNRGEYRQGIFHFDPKKNKYEEIVKIEGDSKVLLGWYIVRLNQNEIHVIDDNNNDLYHIEENKIIKKNHFEFQPIAQGLDKEGKKSYKLVCYFEADKFSLFLFGSVTDESRRVYLYDKKNNTGEVYRDLKNDMDDADMESMNPTRLSIDNSLVFVCPGVSNDKGDYSNPILQILHLKNK